MDTVDIAIAGGGMVGLSLAAALHDSGLSVAVISDQPFAREMPPEPALRVSAINGANYWRMAAHAARADKCLSHDVRLG